MTALETTVEVFRHAIRACVAHPRFQHLGPWRITNTNVLLYQQTLAALDVAQTTGMDTADRTELIIRLLDSFSRNHWSQPRGADGKPNDWSKSLAAGGQIASIFSVARTYQHQLLPGTWDRLVEGLPKDIKRRVPPTGRWYWRKPDGSLYPFARTGDSKAEEVGWHALLLHTAVLVGMTEHQARCEEAIRAAFSMPQDHFPQGWNVYANGEVENHMMPLGTKPGDPNGTPICPHADYQRAVHVAHENIAHHAAVFGVAPPPGLFVHLPEMYAVLTTRNYRTAEGYDPPGGCMYRPDGALYHPRGTDKQTQNVMGFAYLDAIVSRRHPDPAVRCTALEWCRVHAQRMLDQQLAQQARMGAKWDGRFGLKRTGNHTLAQGAAKTYWTLTR